MTVNISRKDFLCPRRSLDQPHLLGPLDYLVHHTIPTSVVFLYNHLDVERLRRSAQALLDVYPHFAGRLRIESDESAVIDNFDQGALFVEASCAEKLLSPTLSSLPNYGNALLPDWDAQPQGTDPILSLQSTRFSCGSVVLGIRIPHIVCDGDGFFQVAQNLAAIYRGEIVSRPVTASYMSDTRRRAPPGFQPRYFTLEAPSTNSQTPKATTGRIMHFPRIALERLKQNATPSGSWITTFEALAALVHQSVYRARLASLGQVSPPDYLSPVNYRTRLNLGASYCANGLITAVQVFDSETLASAPLDSVAMTLHTLLRERIPNNDELINSLCWIQAQPSKSKVASHFRYGSGSLMLSSWAKFDIYEGMTMDAAPLLTTLPFTPITMIDGLGYFLPGRHGGIDVNLALDDRVWSTLRQDDAFSGYVGEWSAVFSLP